MEGGVSKRDGGRQSLDPLKVEINKNKNSFSE